MSNNNILLGVIAKTLNAGGSGLVSAYDGSAKLFNVTMTALSPGEKSKLKSRTKKLENMVKNLCNEVGRESAKFPDPATALEAESVRSIIAKTHDYELEIGQIKQRIGEILAEEAERKAARKKPAKVKSTPKEPAECSCKFDFNSLLIKFKTGEKGSLERQIAENEKKVAALYVDLGKETAKFPDPETALQSEPVQKITDEIKCLKDDIDNKKRRIVEIGAVKKATFQEKMEAFGKKIEEKKASLDKKKEEMKAAFEKQADKAKEMFDKKTTPAPASDSKVTVDVNPADADTAETSCGEEHERSKKAIVARPSLLPTTSGPQYPTASEEEAVRAEKMRKILESYQSDPVEPGAEAPVEVAAAAEAPVAEMVADEAPAPEESGEAESVAVETASAEPEPVVEEPVVEVAAVEVAVETVVVEEVSAPMVSEPAPEETAESLTEKKTFEVDHSQHSSMFRTRTFSAGTPSLAPAADPGSALDLSTFRQKSMGSSGLQFSTGGNPAVTMHHDDSGLRTRSLVSKISDLSEASSEIPAAVPVSNIVEEKPVSKVKPLEIIKKTSLPKVKAPAIDKKPGSKNNIASAKSKKPIKQEVNKGKSTKSSAPKPKNSKKPR